MRRGTTRRARSAQHATLTEAEYQALVDQARADMSIADRLAEEARLRFGTEADAPTESE